MTDRKGVLVKFPPDLLAELDKEAKRTGRPRMDVIIERCRTRQEEPAKKVAIGERAKPTGLQLGPPVYTPGSRLKKR